MNDLHDKVYEPLTIPYISLAVSPASGGVNHFRINVENYNKMTIGSRTHEEFDGLFGYYITAFEDYNCVGNGASKVLLSTTETSDSIEEWDISDYKCVHFTLGVEKAGTTEVAHYFNDIVFSR